MQLGAPGTMEKEQARIAAMRQRNADRLDRFLNAKTRLFGVDTAALRAQHEENCRRAQLEAEAAAAEHETQLAIAAAVDARAAAERESRRRDMESLRRDWQQQARAAEAGKQAERSELLRPIDADGCGPSAVQALRGEDRSRAERVRQQQEQVRRWTALSAEASAERSAVERSTAARHDEELRLAGEMAAAADAEDTSRRAAIAAAVRTQNRRLAADKAARALEWREAQRRADEEEMRVRDAALAENKAEAYAGRRILHDRYKGLTDTQRRALLAGNDALTAERAESRRREAEFEAEMTRQQDELLRAVDAAERDKRRSQKVLEAERQAELRRQRDEVEFRRAAGARERFGAISPSGGFYGGFGQSCR